MPTRVVGPGKYNTSKLKLGTVEGLKLRSKVEPEIDLMEPSSEISH